MKNITKVLGIIALTLVIGFSFSACDNGTTPTVASSKYTNPITISTTTTLKAIAVKTGMTNSEILTETYTITPPGQVVQPTATPAGGYYNTAQTVTLATTTDGVDIHYTLDGTTPTTTSAKYNHSITISETTTLKAIAVKTGMDNSEILTEAYTINLSAYVVTFFPDGRTPAPESPVFKYPGDTITQPAAMTKTGDFLIGWFTDSERKNQASFPITVNANVTLYAKWANTYYSYNDVYTYLNTLTGNSINNPAKLTLGFDLGTMTEPSSGWQQLLAAINVTGKYVNLDLSTCTMNGTSFNPDASVATGKDRIVSIILPNVAASIATNTQTDPTFKNFSNLKTISGAYVETIGDFILYFDFSTLQTIDFPRATNIGRYAFYRCTGLQSVNLPQAMTIGSNAFASCTSLQTVSFPKATSISDSAFQSCTSLKNVSFPATADVGRYPSYSTTYSNPFSGCTSLTTFTLTGTGNLSVIENGKALVRNSTILLAYPSATGSITLNNITSIDGYVFYNCSGLTSVTFNQATSIGSISFGYCTNMKDVNFPKATTIDDYAFYNCTSLQSVSFPQVVTVGYSAFSYCRNLQSVSIPKVTNIGDSAFSSTGNSALTITMGSAAPTLGYTMFDYVTASKSVTVKVPFEATGYSPASSPFNGTTLTVTSGTATSWLNGFRGGSWNGTTWANGELISTASGAARWYSFDVTSGQTYYVWMNAKSGTFSISGDGTKTLETKVDAYYVSGGSNIATGDYAWWNSPKSFTANQTGTVVLKVMPYSSGKTGTFAIVYSTTNSRP